MLSIQHWYRMESFVLEGAGERKQVSATERQAMPVSLCDEILTITAPQQPLGSLSLSLLLPFFPSFSNI